MGNVSKRQQPDHRTDTAEGHHQVFNAARNSRTWLVPHLAPKQILGDFTFKKRRQRS